MAQLWIGLVIGASVGLVGGRLWEVRRRAEAAQTALGATRKMVKDLGFALQGVADALGVQAETLDALGQSVPAVALRAEEDRLSALIRDLRAS